jgi:tRNA A37 threonylcarbamoyladenosine synthetase subunit TsaC/SUA5/YrdC
MAFYNLILRHVVILAPEDRILQEKYSYFIKERRKTGSSAKVFTPDPNNAREIAALIAAGGLVIIPWGKEERRILCLIGCHDIPGNTVLMNRIKGRPDDQPVAIGCLPETTDFVADVTSSIPLKKVAIRLFNKNEDEVTEGDFLEVLNRIYSRSIGLVLKAKDDLPHAVTRKVGDLRTVLIAGERDYREPHDIYNQTLLELATRFGKVIAGTSANPSDNDTYSVYDQEIAFSNFGDKVDGFVKYPQTPTKSKKKMFLTSSTIIDLTGDRPMVIRWGNLHPKRFKDLFPDLIIPKDVKRNKNFESNLYYYLHRLRQFI